jgi:archaellum component FlaC
MTLSDEERLDITDLIYEVVSKIEDDRYDDYSDLLKALKEESSGIYEGINRLNARMDTIEKMIQAHAIGVQNVYKELQTIKSKDYYNLNN